MVALITHLSISSCRFNSYAYLFTSGVHEMLQGVAEELQFQVVYTLLDEKNTDDMFQCLIHMSTSPESVCFAVGATEDEAKMTAATNAIKYLKVMATKMPPKS